MAEFGLKHVENVGGQEIDYGYYGPEKFGDAKYYSDAIERTNRVASKMDSLVASNKFTPTGIQEAIADTYKQAFEANNVAKRDVEREIQDANAKLSAIALSGVKKPAEGEQFVDWQLAALYRGFSADEKAAVHLDISQGLHQEMAQALVRLPQIATGVLAQRRTQIIDSLMTAENKQQQSYVEARLKRLAACKQALAGADTAMRLHARLTPSKAREITGEPSPTAALLASIGAGKGG